MPPPRGIVQQLDQELHKSLLLPRRARLLVGVSGGADSVALLRLLHGINQSNYWRWTLLVGHVEHGIRGRASVADARFTRKLAAALELPCFTRRFKLGSHASEDTARKARLGALKSMAAAQRCQGVVLGHHADDQAETVLLQLFRGTGLAGLAGMAPDSTVEGLRIYRPLLGLRRWDLRAFLERAGQSFREDASNFSEQYLRNRVRKKILPQVERLAPGAVWAITRTAILARQAQHLIHENLRQLLATALVVQTPRRVHLHRDPLKFADPFLCSEVLRRAMGHVGGSNPFVDFERISEAVHLIQSTAGTREVQMGGGVHLHLTCSAVTLSRSTRS